jgi:two-component system cell cycle sensor histidine kinase/response regulator CckA
MSESDAAPSVETPIVDRSERGGNVTLLVTLALSLVAAAGTFALLDRTLAEPYVMGLLGLLAVVGVFSLFGGAVGLLRFGARGDGENPLAKRFLDTMVDGVCVTDAEGRIVYANAAYGRLIRAETASEVRTV